MDRGSTVPGPPTVPKTLAALTGQALGAFRRQYPRRSPHSRGRLQVPLGDGTTKVMSGTGTEGKSSATCHHYLDLCLNLETAVGRPKLEVYSAIVSYFKNRVFTCWVSPPPHSIARLLGPLISQKKLEIAG